MCRSRDTYIGLPVEKYELVSAPGLAFTTRAIAARTAGLLRDVDARRVEDDDVRRPHAGSERLERPLARPRRRACPGTARLWYHRDESFPAAKPPNSVSTIQAAITGQR